MLTMHMTLSDGATSQSDIVREVKQFLHHEYGIGHSTIEVDVDGCSDH
jgi:Co/Zn/Cd efflux system component